MEKNLLDPSLRELSKASNNDSSFSQQQISHSLDHRAPFASNSPPQQQQHNFHTPPSVGDHVDNTGDFHGDGNNDSNDPKRSRACEACRGLKVRCEPSDIPDAPCRRCTKARRNCVVTLPSRKRQKKTDSRVAELEKKINALTASLQAQGAAPAVMAALAGPGDSHESQGGMRTTETQHNPYQQVTNGGYGSPYSSSRPEARSDEWNPYPRVPDSDSRTPSAPPMVVAGQKRKHVDSFPAASGTMASANSGVQRQAQEAVGLFHLLDASTQKGPPIHEYADIVDKGLATAEEATKMFEYYCEKMTPHMPAIVFPRNTTAAEIRKTKPILFLAILSASAGILHPEKQRALTKEVMSIYADRIICSGEKTLELVQALIVSSLWYWPPEHFEELKFYQLIHIASVMAIDIGMNKRSKSSKNKVAGLFRDNPWRRTPFPDSESLESRRTWLACYFLCCNASMGLRRPNLVRWTPFMNESVDLLETSPDALPSDKTFSQWIRSQHIAEDIGTRFSMDDPNAKVSISDPSVEHALRGFEIELEAWTNQIPPEVNSPCLQVTEHVVNLYMHEVAMHVDHNVEEFKPPYTAALLRETPGNEQNLSSSHVRALSICLKSIDGIFATFLSFDVETTRCLPVANFVRVAYAVVVLIKMYFAAANPNSNFGKVIDKDNMKVEQYLDGLISLFKAAAQEDRSLPSQKFLMVLLMLKTWFHRQREEKPPGSSNGSGTGDASTEAAGDQTQNSNAQLQRSQPAPSSLQLLSEVATGNSGDQSLSGNTSNYPSEWQQQMQMNNYSMGPGLQGYGTMGFSNIDPSLGMDSSYSIGDGWEHAMGMTLGVGDFGDNNFFGGLMDFGDNVAQNFDGLL